mmetsp:Transcript_25317/g.45624  ORF Transcript_25317/g.45624 Transcript_25317/m.45624 type:complete len:261 (-) Transcript_25317:158-940(-)|eukprot:CAMPEP_0201883892 /NCGR_PEP_ID=MMETSP0902-20130614/16290_1 /ASSEMBLY_ACC=CAM_ASM_000551 /TAXON_ID=420261 /ORGANISM="Thalassiosira antarctica, Strain CCMP982" /LENGTH=260 /DNA_ID=CAMNT_0048412759 /DNA_START=87 /DNA_END=869 /DNA_ORIENTATION=-
MSSSSPMDPSKISSIVADGNEMRRIDLEVSEVLSITRVQEVASTRLADLITYHLGLNVGETTPVVVVVGKGNNGANGIAAARHLVGRFGRGNITVLLGVPNDQMNDMPREQLKLYEHFGGRTVSWTGKEDQEGLMASLIAKEGTIIVDGLLGTGIAKPPRSNIKDVIEWVNSTSLPVLALDVPSGLNHVTGEVLEPCIRAKWTFNFHILKSGQVAPSARNVIGELWTADTDLTYTSWEEAGVKPEAIQELYSAGPIRRVF